MNLSKFKDKKCFFYYNDNGLHGLYNDFYSKDPFIRHGLYKFENIGYYYQNKQKGFWLEYQI